MKKIIYTTPEGTLSIIIPSPKEKIEAVIGPLTDAEYEEHVRSRALPADASNVRTIEDSDIPSTREFRNAWVDTQPGSQIDISLEKARDLKLEELRRQREVALAENDKEFNIAMKKGQATAQIEAKAQALRDATEPLKALDVVGKYNDEALLQQIRDLAVLPE